MANFYISDTHFGHFNIMKHSRRGFETVEEMDRVFIENWNSVVTNKDDVWILGDFCWSKDKSPKWYLNQLKGRKHLIVGNHDSAIMKNKEFQKYFVSIDYIKTISDGSRRIVLCHYPMVEWDGFFRGSYHLFGHIHNNKNNAYETMKNIDRAYNVGTDILGYTPRRFDDVVKYNENFWKEN